MSSATPRIAYILPSYRHFGYSRRCLQSLFRCSPDAVAFVVDDGSPDWSPQWLEGLRGTVILHRFEDNGGLTRAWNTGLTRALSSSFDLIVAGNNDVLFTRGWWRALEEAIAAGLALVGPLTNAPGPQATQQVSRYTTYTPTDDEAINDEVARELYDWHGGEYSPCAINGFFMAARPLTWLKYAHHGLQVFPDRIERMPSGRRNPTPLMTGQEDWLNSQIARAGEVTGAALGSFIFHYRSVTRGERYAQGDWLRAADGSPQV